MDLSVITVTYQSHAYIGACILSVMAHTLNCEYEHIIVDNGSTDGTVALIEMGYASHVRLIKNKTNRGFAYANNQAISEAKGRYLLFLNPDMEIVQGSIGALLSCMDLKPHVGILSCKLLSCHQKPHPILRPCRFPTLSAYLPALLKLRPFFCTVHPHFFYPSFKDDEEQAVEVVRGAFMLMPKRIADQLGYAFDPLYFILFEDVDLCRTVASLGYQIVYTPSVSCIDHCGQSFEKQSLAWKYLQGMRSLKTYVRKWHSRWHLVWLSLLIPLGFLLRIPEWGIKSTFKALFKTDG